MAKKGKTTTELLMDLRGVVDAALAEAERLDEKGVKAAAGRVRKAMMEAKRLAQEVRVTANDRRNAL